MPKTSLKPIQTWLILAIITALSSGSGCRQNSQAAQQPASAEAARDTLKPVVPMTPEPAAANVIVTDSILIREFFQYLDKLVAQYDTLAPYPLSENLILRANPWIIDTLRQTDYYQQMAKGQFVYNQTKMPVLRPGDTLLIPGPKLAAKLLQKMADTWLDLNIPAFTLRIMERDSELYSIPVRVGKNEAKNLELAGHLVDLRTRTGEGQIFRVNRYPIFIDPVTGERFKYTKRDDRRTTLMPQIPWIEPIINGIRYGQLIHPTTNPRSLGKAASNGCIGTSEADAWLVYAYAPVGTKIRIRYDLTDMNTKGDTLHYPDIYAPKKKPKMPGTAAGAAPSQALTAQICQCDQLF